MSRKVISLSLKLIIIFLVLTKVKSLKGAKDQSNYECQNNTMKKIDSYLNELDIVPSSTKTRFPETLDRLQEFCKANVKILNMITTLVNKCLTGFKQNLMRITLYSIRNSQKILCKKRPTAEMKGFVAAGKCVNSGRPKFRHCIRKASQNIYAIKLMPDKLKIPLICCEIYRAKSCLLYEANNVKECKPENIETLQTRFYQASANTMSFACGDYTEESDKCNSLKAPKISKSSEFNRSIVSVLFEVLNHLPGEEQNNA